MTESEIFESILGINEIQVDRVEWQDQSLHIYCSSIFSEALCPNCLNKRQVINQIYERKFRDLPITGKEVYLHLQQRQFYCPDCDRYFNEPFSGSSWFVVEPVPPQRGDLANLLIGNVPV
jgi:transposase